MYKIISNNFCSKNYRTIENAARDAREMAVREAKQLRRRNRSDRNWYFENCVDIEKAFAVFDSKNSEDALAFYTPISLRCVKIVYIPAKATITLYDSHGERYVAEAHVHPDLDGEPDTDRFNALDWIFDSITDSNDNEVLDLVVDVNGEAL